MRQQHTSLLATAIAVALTLGAVNARAGEPAPAKAHTPTAKTATPAASASGGPVKPGKVNAGGDGGSVTSNGSTTAGQVGPKKPKCPDPTKCPAEKAVAQ